MDYQGRTKPHPDGEAPRTADGQVIGADGTPMASTRPATKAPRRARTPRPKPAPPAAPPATPQDQDAD